MDKKYLDMNVYEALQKRFDFIFQEFTHILVSFSGGKDSGLLLDLLMEYRNAHGITRKIGVFHQDFEAQYSYTTRYVEETFERYLDQIEPYWVCLPMAVRTAVSQYEMFWYPWDDQKKELWVRPMPQKPYVIHLGNNPFWLYRYKMHQEDLAKQFSRWYHLSHGGGRTICLLGIRASESANRYQGIMKNRKGYKETCWITKGFKDVWVGMPMYDWNLNDVWKAIAQHHFSYNKIYDMYYKAGLKPHQMRVASPFNEYAVESLNLYRVIEPKTWAKLVGRVQGANFTALYTKNKATGYRTLRLPTGHTWRSYTYFLLETLPPKLRRQYMEKFKTSIRFWHKVGGGLSEKTIRELEEKGYRIRRNGISNYTKYPKSRIIFEGKIPDDTDDISSTRDIPSWKRMCYCILTNDHMCRSMGFGLSRQKQRHVDSLRKKYQNIIKNYAHTETIDDDTKR